MNCQNCGHDNSSWAKTCAHCGQTIERHAAAGVPAPSNDAAPTAAPLPANDLQLERAEFDNPAQASTCAGCGTPLTGQYYQVNDKSVCPRCCEQVRASYTAGSPVTRALVAIGAGIAAAIGGSILYYAILAMTGYEFGLIAIVVGYGVGRAVNWGSGARGGRFYQAVAIALTYLAIVSAYVPLVVSEIRKADETPQTATDSGNVATATPVGQSAAAAPEKPADAAPATEMNPFAAVAILLGILLAMPFLGGIENIMGLVIIGIGLYEAWKLNRPRVLEITGPHTISMVAPAGMPG
jgi:hypothetical protein